MKEKQIAFTAPMVRAILEGRKTQTRRIVKPVKNFEQYDVCSPDQAYYPWDVWWHKDPGLCVGVMQSCPYGKPGDRLWVKETYSQHPQFADIAYKADGDEFEDSGGFLWVPKWKSSRFMPRWASRITLEITGVRVERLQDISEGDIFREGIQRLENHSWHATGAIPLGTYRGLDEWTDKVNYWVDPRDAYKALWDSIHGPGSWGKNPWVWVVEFKRVEGK